MRVDMRKTMWVRTGDMWKDDIRKPGKQVVSQRTAIRGKSTS